MDATPNHEQTPQGTQGTQDTQGPQTTAQSPLTDVHVQLSGQDGNAFMALALVRRGLQRGGHADLVEVFTAEATAGDYDNLLQICERYVHIS